MADPVARPAVPDAEAGAGGAQILVVVRVLVVELQEVVIDILGGELGAHPTETHCFQFEHHERAGSVLGQRLIDTQPDLLAGRQLAVDQMRCDQLLGHVLRGTHRSSPEVPVATNGAASAWQAERRCGPASRFLQVCSLSKIFRFLSIQGLADPVSITGVAVSLARSLASARSASELPPCRWTRGLSTCCEALPLCSKTHRPEPKFPRPAQRSRRAPRVARTVSAAAGRDFPLADAGAEPIGLSVVPG